MSRKLRVVVVGGGPAGLAAAARLLEQGGSDVHVRLFTMGHGLGGKAASWRDAEGRLIDHGQHVVVGFYREMRALLRRAGVEPAAHLVSNSGVTHVYESRDQKVHDLKLSRNPLRTLLNCVGYSGFTSGELLNITQFVLRTLGTWLGTQDIEQFDDVCFTGWCWKNGLAPSVIKTHAFRIARDAQLNHPGEISAYQLLKALRAFARDSSTCEYSFPDGGMTERFWNPIASHIARLGGEIHFGQQLVGLSHERGRITGIRVADPQGHGHDVFPGGHRGPQVPVEPKEGTERLVDDFDAVVVAIPEGCFKRLNLGDEAFWSIPEFARAKKLRSVSPLGLQIWHREPVTRRYPSVIAGLPAPLGFVVDNKPIIREYRDDPRFGSVLYFVGQATGFEDLSDADLLSGCLDAIQPLPGFERIDRDGIIHYAVARNAGPHGCYWYTEPGTLRLRPHQATPFSNLLLAGDWIRGELDFPCMEGAIRSGRAAADAALSVPARAREAA